MHSEDTIPAGLCQCGCGERTRPSKYGYGGYKVGEPQRFIEGHVHRRRTYWLVDRGSGCWLWQGAPINSGYGVIYRDGRDQMAHRWVYEQHRGPVPEGMVLDHLCHVRLCVNPDHLEVATVAENSRRHRRTKLTADQVREIRAVAGEMSYKDIAAKYGISRSQVSLIVTRYSWKDV